VLEEACQASLNAAPLVTDCHACPRVSAGNTNRQQPAPDLAPAPAPAPAAPAPAAVAAPIPAPAPAPPAPVVTNEA